MADIKQKIGDLVQGLSSTAKQHPAEMLISVIYCILACIYYKFEQPPVEAMLIYYPVFFLIVYIIGRLTRDTKLYPLYYLSALAGALLAGRDFDDPEIYAVSLIVVQLAYLICSWRTDNTDFIRNALHYLNALFSAALLSVVTWLLILSLYWSVRYIFELDDTTWNFMIYASFLIYMFVLPLLFLLFNQKEEDGILAPGKIFDAFFNYVLSPVLLAYTAILYLYLIKITVSWSLPKGGVAYIVSGFAAYAFLLRGCREFLTRRLYDWFFDRTSLIVSPTLAMYWIGTCRRISQYGFTEPRVYLVVIGLILTVTVLLFFSKRWGRYLYAAFSAAILLSAVTYIPGFTAGDIEKWSQSKREANMTEGQMNETDPVYLTIEHNGQPVDISGYRNLQVIGNYESDNTMWSDYSQDTLYLYAPGQKLVFKTDMRSFLRSRLENAGVTPGDTIPVSVYPSILKIETDSSALLLNRLFLEQKNSGYSVTNVQCGYYLSK